MFCDRIENENTCHLCAIKTINVTSRSRDGILLTAAIESLPVYGSSFCQNFNFCMCMLFLCCITITRL